MRRPLIVLTGQGVARADGFNLTRRMKATRRLAALTRDVRRKDRQNLDALLAACAAGGETALEEVVHDLRTICLKERRTTLRKTAHRDVFASLAVAAESRLVVHLTTNVDGLTTTFAVRDHGACWPPFTAPASVAAVVEAAQATIERGSGLLHVPLHGEAGLLVSATDETMQTAYGTPRALAGQHVWVPSLCLAIASDPTALERRLPSARLGYALLDALLRDEAGDASGVAVPARAAADLLVIGYGAEDGGARAGAPFERRIDALAASATRDSGARWTALVYRPDENAVSARWFAERGFAVVPYDDGDLAHVVQKSLTRQLPAARCVRGDEAPLRAGRDGPQP